MAQLRSQFQELIQDNLLYNINISLTKYRKINLHQGMVDQDLDQIYEEISNSNSDLINGTDYEKKLENDPNFIQLKTDDNVDQKGESSQIDYAQQIYAQSEESTKHKNRIMVQNKIYSQQFSNSHDQFQVQHQQESSTRIRIGDVENKLLLKKKKIRKSETQIWVQKEKLIRDAQKNMIQFFSGIFKQCLISDNICKLSNQEIQAVRKVNKTPTIDNMNQLFKMGGNLRLELAKLFTGNRLWVKIQGSKIRNLYSKLVYKNKINVLRNAFYKQNLRMLSTSI